MSDREVPFAFYLAVDRAEYPGRASLPVEALATHCGDAPYAVLGTR
jgi:hypothetical protein